MADPAIGQEHEDVGLDRVATQRLERERRDEAGRRRREEDDDLGALGLEEPEQLDGLEGGDRAGDAEGDQPAGEAFRHALTRVIGVIAGGPARAARRR
jgi:hypothetical protein